MHASWWVMYWLECPCYQWIYDIVDGRRQYWEKMNQEESRWYAMGLEGFVQQLVWKCFMQVVDKCMIFYYFELNPWQVLNCSYIQRATTDLNKTNYHTYLNPQQANKPLNFKQNGSPPWHIVDNIVWFSWWDKYSVCNAACPTGRFRNDVSRPRD